MVSDDNDYFALLDFAQTVTNKLISDQPSAALRGGAEHTRAGVVRARAFMLIFAAPALIPAPFIC